MSQMTSPSSLIRRCAWCERVWTDDGWSDRQPKPEPERETSTICSECVDDLQAVNLSR